MGHTEREACLQELIEQHVAGRLSVVELHERQEAAAEALTVADLERLTADLPARSRRARSRSEARTARRHTHRPQPRREGTRLPGPIGRVRASKVALTATAASAATLVLAADVAYGGEGHVLSAGLASGVIGLLGGWWAACRSH